jgi:hypothetical protein
MQYRLRISKQHSKDHSNFISRRSRDVLQFDQQRCPRDHVLLLFDVRAGTRVPEVPLVEETSDHHSAGELIS